MASPGVCDVCAADINAGEGKRYTPLEFRLLASRGFAPPRSALRPNDPSISYDDAVVWWRDHLVAQSDTDWALCDACVAVAARYETGAPAAHATGPVTDLDTYLALIHRQFTVARELKDGTPVTGMSADELALVTRLVVDASKPENADHFRAYYELPPTADAYIVVLLGWRLYLTRQAARSGGDRAIFAAVDTAGATLSARSLSVLSGLEYTRWGDLAKIDLSAPGQLDDAVIVGDLDLPQTGAGKLLTNYDGTISPEQTIAFVMSRARRAKGTTIFFHRTGWTSPFDVAKISAAVTAPPKTSACFVATACYGSPEHPAVNTLRMYRDDVLRGSAAGRAFIQVYAWTGPALARWISRRPAMRAWVRDRVIAPLAARVSRRVSRRAERAEF